MSNPTTPFSWQMPTATDLVTDLPADFEVFGQAVATSMADLLGGTSGQILAKNSNTDMDFVWVTNDVGDITAVTAGTGISGGGTSGAVTITNSMATEITAKGDLIVGTGSATFDNLAAGANGSTIVADSSTSTGLRYTGNYAAGKNAIINGDFRLNQRNFTSITTTGSYGFDRWVLAFSGGSCTYTPQVFTPGTAPVAGYEGTNFTQLATTGGAGASDYTIYTQRIEDVRTYAGQTVTLSFWAKAASGTPKVAGELWQVFGSGGSASSAGAAGQAVTISTSWARYSITFNNASISGKTVGTSSYLEANLWVSGGSTYASRNASIGAQTATISFWGVQLESGSVATAFQTATGTLQGELAAAQRYYQRFGAKNGQTVGTNATYGTGFTTSTTGVNITVPFPVTMRTTPTAIEYASIIAYDAALTQYTPSAVAIVAGQSGLDAGNVQLTVTGATAARAAVIIQSATTGYLAFSAEL